MVLQQACGQHRSKCNTHTHQKNGAAMSTCPAILATTVSAFLRENKETRHIHVIRHCKKNKINIVQVELQKDPHA
jgi:hypothetical protein